MVAPIIADFSVSSPACMCAERTRACLLIADWGGVLRAGFIVAKKIGNDDGVRRDGRSRGVYQPGTGALIH